MHVINSTVMGNFTYVKVLFWGILRLKSFTWEILRVGKSISRNSLLGKLVFEMKFLKFNLEISFHLGRLWHLKLSWSLWILYTYLTNISYEHILCTYLIHISYSHSLCSYLMLISYAHILWHISYAHILRTYLMQYAHILWT